jgi:hypothetical protein
MSNLLDTYIRNESNRNENTSHSVQFWLYLISNILSIICCFILLVFLLYNRTLRNALHNHIVIVLLFICLIYELIDIPIILYNYRYELSWKTTSILYRFWSFIDIGLYTNQLILFAWSIIERHILIFHNQWLSTAKKRFYIHYLPIIILIIYCLVWYSVTILFPFCFNLIDQHCMLFNPSIKYFDLICNQFLPSLIIIIFSIALLIRARWEKAQSKQRLMIFQILSISILYFIFYTPWLFVLICLQFHSLENIGLNWMPYAYFFSYYFIFLFPFVCCASLPEVQIKLKKLLFQR